MDETFTADEQQRVMRDYQTTITILEHLSDAIFILNPQGIIQYANRVATDLLGENLENLLGKNLNDFLDHPFQFHKIGEEENEKTFLEHIYQNGTMELESELLNRGYRTPVIINFGIVRNKNDEVNYIIASARDMTMRKALEKELYQQQLFAQSRDRYRELGELAINIVHRLSQPITSIHLLVEMMQRQTATNQVDTVQFQKNFDQIKEMLNLMNEVITNVRNFAFLTEEENLNNVNVKQSVEQAVEQLHYELTEDNVNVRLEYEDDLPFVLANPLNLQQVFSALLRFYLDLFHKHHSIKKRQVLIRLHNYQNRWIEITVHNSVPKKILKQSQKKNSGPALLEQYFSIALVELILTSIGGDFNYRRHSSEYHSFLLRIPAAHSDERQQLRNLIDLMH